MEKLKKVLALQIIWFVLALAAIILMGWACVQESIGSRYNLLIYAAMSGFLSFSAGLRPLKSFVDFILLFIFAFAIITFSGLKTAGSGEVFMPVLDMLLATLSFIVGIFGGKGFQYVDKWRKL